MTAGCSLVDASIYSADAFIYSTDASIHSADTKCSCTSAFTILESSYELIKKPNPEGWILLLGFNI